MNNKSSFTMHLKNPPKKIFAYQHSTPGSQVMGVAIEAQSGKILEAIILPTKQRVMLGLGVGNKAAHAHHTYRTFGGINGYELIWIEDPETDERTAFLKKKLVKKANEMLLAPNLQAKEAKDEEPIKKEELLGINGVTEELVKQGIETPIEEKEKEPTTGGFF